MAETPCNEGHRAADTPRVASPSWIHLTARMSPTAPALTREETCAWLWAQMRSAFPDAIAAVLMPDHPHLVLASDDPERERQRLARLLGAFGRYFDVGGKASLVAPAEPIRPGTVLARQVRYVALNPCRKGLAKCPLAWRWSTHRDVVGASVDPWVTASRLARALGGSPNGFARRHHAYVSADPNAAVRGTSFPVAAPTTTIPELGLRTIADASVAALRLPSSSLRVSGAARSLFIALAIDQGWKLPARLAEMCGCSIRTIHRHISGVDAAGLDAARLSLGDARLRA